MFLSGSSFELVENTLVVRGELEPECQPQFEQALEKLTGSEHADIILDLSDVHYISSSYVRYVAAAAVDMKRAGRTLTVRGSREVRRLMQLGGIDRLCTVELAAQT